MQLFYYDCVVYVPRDGTRGALAIYLGVLKLIL